MFYREVCCLTGKSSLEDNVSKKAICSDCGKQFVNIKGLKQHMQRMHKSIEQVQAASSTKDDQIVTIPEQNTEINEYLQNIIVDLAFKDKTLDNVKEGEDEELISQCWVCGNTFSTETELNEHMNSDHPSSDKSEQCVNDQTEITKLLEIIDAKEDIIKSTTGKNKTW